MGDLEALHPIWRIIWSGLTIKLMRCNSIGIPDQRHGTLLDKWYHMLRHSEKILDDLSLRDAEFWIDNLTEISQL